MNDLLTKVSGLSLLRKMTIVGAVLLSMASILFISQTSSGSTMALLHAGLEGRAAGDVIAKLEQMGVPSEIRGSAIYVDSKDRDRVRMQLAADGLPASTSQQGYELLDGLSGFGTTAEMFDAAYWRAKEGELARTLLATPDISQARVHIGTPRRRSFSNTQAVPTASITLTGTAGSVSRSSAMAARYLVSLAIPGLDADQVAVIDANNGVLLRPGDETGGMSGYADSERAQKMKAEIAAILAARVGDGRARVSVNIETTRESETISRRVIDPDSKSLRESRTVEMAETGEGSAGNATVASNLPDGDAANRESSSSRDENRQTEVFDYTETVEDIVRPAGTIKRISVAVLLDEIRTTADDGTITSQPRPRQEIVKLEALVKSSIGFDEERGDLVTVESIPFADVPQEGSVATLAAPPSFIEANQMQLIQLATIAFAILILGLFVLRPVLMARSTPALSSPDYGDDGGMTDIGGSMPGGLPDLVFAEMDDDFSDPGTGIGSGLSTENVIEVLRDTITNKNDESVEVLRVWLNGGDTVQAAS